MKASTSGVLTAAAAVAVLATVSHAAQAQSVTLGNVNVSMVGARTFTGSQPARELAAMPAVKLNPLLAWINTEMGAPVTTSPRQGFTEQVVTAYTSQGSTIQLETHLTVISLEYTSARHPGSTAALLCVTYPKFPQLSYPRLLVRYNPDWDLAEEYSYRLDNRVTKMTAKFGDCVWRSSNGIATKLLPAEQRSYFNVFVASQKAREPLAVGLRRIMDVSGPPIGQRSLLLCQSLEAINNFEEEWNSGVIDGVVDTTLPKLTKDSKIKALFHSLLTEVKHGITEAIKNAIKDTIGKLIKSLF